MIFIFLFLLCAVNSYGANEGDNCTKEGVAGVCTNIRKCLAAQQDIENRREPQICNFLGADPIVCCVSPVTTTTTTTTKRPRGNCILPPYPKYGTYTTNVANGKPGDDHDIFVINTTCRHDYNLDGSRIVFCYDGWWTEPMPECIRNAQCHLMPHVSVIYNCIVAEGGKENYDRGCEEFEPHGSLIRPRCRGPRYYSSTPLSLMRCVDGSLNYVKQPEYNPDTGEDDSQETPWDTIYTKACKRRPAY